MPNYGGLPTARESEGLNGIGRNDGGETGCVKKRILGRMGSIRVWGLWEKKIGGGLWKGLDRSIDSHVLV